MTKTGRPKTAQGHREDVMLGMLEVRGKFASLVKMKQRHYREERDLIDSIDEDLRDGCLSERFAEIVERHAASAAQVAGHLRGER